MPNPLKELARFKVSPWLDNLSRRLVASGDLARMIREDGIRGITSNPTIFEKAISGSGDYDAHITRLIARNETDPKNIYEALAVQDVQEAADLLRSVFDQSGGADGFVSLEVAPDLAADTEGTIREAKRLRALVNRPNVFIKVPATKEGVPAIERLLGEGVPVNVTLIFAISRYEEVMAAYLAGLERYEKTGKTLSDIHSVASFFVSRIDTAVDAQLKDPALMGKAAIANAKLAYARYKGVFSSARFQRLAKKGARAQRPLWASTSTKNPKYRDVVYVEELIGPDTVNTMPEPTVIAFRDHGKLRGSLEENVGEARRTMERLKKAGIDFAAVTDRLERDGVASFAKSFESLLSHIEAKTRALHAATGTGGKIANTSGRTAASAGGANAAQPSQADQATRTTQAAQTGLARFRHAIDALLKAAQADAVIARLWKKDASLWKKEPKHQAVISDSLGWLTMPDWARLKIQELADFAEEIRNDRITHVLLLGMGGSSLAPEVFRQTFGIRKGWPELVILDSTDPEAVAAAGQRCDPRSTLYLVSSKSGTTTEPLRLFDHFWSQAAAALGSETGRHFSAITDPDSHLEKLAREKQFRRVFANPSDVGGRFSALSYFGLVPAALAGVAVSALIEQARKMKEDCARADPGRNPGLRLGCELGAMAKEGRDKLTFLVSSKVSGLGLWLEQLLAESSGKEGKGVAPISEEPRIDARKYGKDRVFIHVSCGPDAETESFTRELEAAGQPVLRIELADRLDLAAEFFRWEIATAVLGWSLGVNPFDQPNVQEAKEKTKRLLDALAKKGGLPQPPVQASAGALSLAFSKAAKAAASSRSIEEALPRFLAEVKTGDYIGLLAYASPWTSAERDLQALRLKLLESTGAAVQFGYGPRYLHSTGQLHKGGPNSGVFILFSREDYSDGKIPGAGYSFGQLITAQALGDFQALDGAGRRAVLVRFRGDLGPAIRELTQLFSTGRAALGVKS